MKAEYQNGVSAYVDDIHQHGHLHGYFGVAHGAKDGRAGIIESNKGDGRGYNEKIYIGMVHNIRVNLAEYHMKNEIFSHIHNGHDDNSQNGHKPDQLISGFTGALLSLASQVLTGYHGASCGQGLKCVD